VMQIQLAGQVQNDDPDASELCGVIKKLAPILGCGLLYNQILNHVSSCLKVQLNSLVKDLQQ